MTAEGGPDLPPEVRKRLADELATLRTRRRELAGALEEWDRVGDRGDSSEALELGEDAAWLDERIGELVARLAGAVPWSGPVEAAPSLPDGARVTLRLADSTVVTLRVVAIPEEIPEGAEDTALTTHSPLGRALAGHGPGDVVRYPTPGGPVEVVLLDLQLPGSP